MIRETARHTDKKGPPHVRKHLDIQELPNIPFSVGLSWTRVFWDSKRLAHNAVQHFVVRYPFTHKKKKETNLSLPFWASRCWVTTNSVFRPVAGNKGKSRGQVCRWFVSHPWCWNMLKALEVGGANSAQIHPIKRLLHIGKQSWHICVVLCSVV